MELGVFELWGGGEEGEAAVCMSVRVRVCLSKSLVFLFKKMHTTLTHTRARIQQPDMRNTT